MKIKKEIIIGLVVIASLCLLVVGFNFLKGRLIFQNNRIYYAVYNKIGGLITSSPVLINGFKIGQVNDIHFHPDKSGRLVVALLLNSDIQIPENSIAKIYSLDLMGTKGIEITFSDLHGYLHPGDTLKTSIERELKEEVNAQMIPLKNKAEELMSTFDSLLTAFNSVFTDSVRENLKKSFFSIRQAVQNISQTTGAVNSLVIGQSSRIADIFTQIHNITEAISNSSKDISKIISNFSSISDSLTKINFTTVIRNTNSTLISLNEVISRINRGEGTIGLLAKDDQLYHNLQNSSAELYKLLQDIRENPKKYLHFSLISFGKDKKQKDISANQSDAKLQHDSFYSIQIMSGKTFIPSDSPVFTGLDSVFVFNNNGYFKYLTGYTHNIDSIYSIKSRIKLLFPDAFIVSFKEGKQVPLF
ncbi:MAG: MlaD family protein [Bacteroidia bacterium]|nr:MlaD family protein [Bacteroidia bacterium]